MWPTNNSAVLKVIRKVENERTQRKVRWVDAVEMVSAIK